MYLLTPTLFYVSVTTLINKHTHSKIKLTVT